MEKFLGTTSPTDGNPISVGYLPAHLLTKAFPFYLAFDRTLRIVQIGDGLRKLLPKLAPGALLPQHFSIKRPVIACQFDAIREKSQALFLLESRQTNLHLKGQMMDAAPYDTIFFLGAPWITSISTLSGLGTKLTDSNVHGSTSDLLVLLQARSTTLSDTRRLAEQLAEQRTDLRRAVHQAELAKTVLEQAAEAIEIADVQMRLLYVNAAFENMTGYTRQEVVGQRLCSRWHIEQQTETLCETIWQTISVGQVWQGACWGRRKNGSTYPQEATVFPVHDRRGVITNYVAIRRDISDRKRTQSELQHSLSLLKATLESTADGILVVDQRGRVDLFNQKFLEMWRIPPAIATLGHDHTPLLEFVLEQLDDPHAFLTKVQSLYDQPEATSYDVLHFKDGRVFERYSLPQRLNHQIVGRVWNFRDVTDRHRKEATIRYQASHDPLTGLPNRVLFREHLEIALQTAQDQHTQLAVCFLDLDRFKLINDTLGHAVGDRLLQDVARRLKSCLQPQDLVARWAGDEFTVLIPCLTQTSDAVQTAERILDSFKPAFCLEGYDFHPTISIGIARYPIDGNDAETLIKNADAALYKVKAAGRNGYQFYAPLMNSKASALLALEADLHHALERNQFALHYQPLVQAATGAIVQMEALLRWHHPDRGWVPPSQFIPLAEETGLIGEIEGWVLRTACQQNQLWRLQGLPPLRLGVNLSARQFQNRHLATQIDQILQDYELEPASLELEITESIAMQNVESTRSLLNDLHSLGVRLSLDDFGTGYSSLSYLKNFPLHTLKIDRSFVQELSPHSKDLAIVSAIIALGKGLALGVVAEGVETIAQYDLLQALQCEMMQGFLFSPPLPPDTATTLLMSIRPNPNSLCTTTTLDSALSVRTNPDTCLDRP